MRTAWLGVLFVAAAGCDGDFWNDTDEPFGSAISDCVLGRWESQGCSVQEPDRLHFRGDHTGTFSVWICEEDCEVDWDYTWSTDDDAITLDFASHDTCIPLQGGTQSADMDCAEDRVLFGSRTWYRP